MDQVDVIIVGAGVVGLAVAAELSTRFEGAAVVVFERHARFGQETSSRNSEVIHAGIYYPVESLKTKLCVEGNRRLYEYCAKWNVPHRRIGKLIVARTEDEIPLLESILNHGYEVGVNDLERLDEAQVAKLEPNIQAAAAVFSPSTGIVDSHKLMVQLEHQARRAGVFFAYLHDVQAINRLNDGYEVVYQEPGGGRDSLGCRWLINCAGLAADQIACKAGIDVDQADYRLHPCKGEYFSLANARAKAISHLIYPLPLKELKGLGIHLTQGLDGRMRLGPNAFYVDKLDYGVDPAHGEEFYQAAKAYLPFLERDHLQPDMAGIRPKLQAEGEGFRDFVIRHEADRGLEGLVNLVGIESPGLTSCLSIAGYVGDLLREIS